MMARQRVFVFVSFFLTSKCYQVLTRNVRIQDKDHNRPTREVHHCFCKVKNSLSIRSYLSPSNSIVSEIAAASQILAGFCGSFVETQARFQQTRLFS